MANVPNFVQKTGQIVLNQHEIGSILNIYAVRQGGAGKLTFYPRPGKTGL